MYCVSCHNIVRTYFFTLQTQRKYELEADLRVKTEGRLREVEEQLQAEINTRMQISSSSQHTNEKVNQLERQVRTVECHCHKYHSMILMHCFCF